MHIGTAKTFEKRQIVGQIIKGNKLDVKTELALINGIYYRFILLGKQMVELDQTYKVIQNVGNVVTLKKQENED